MAGEYLIKRYGVNPDDDSGFDLSDRSGKPVLFSLDENESEEKAQQEAAEEEQLRQEELQRQAEEKARQEYLEQQAAEEARIERKNQEELERINREHEENMARIQREYEKRQKQIWDDFYDSLGDMQYDFDDMNYSYDGDDSYSPTPAAPQRREELVEVSRSGSPGDMCPYCDIAGRIDTYTTNTGGYIESWTCRNSPSKCSHGGREYGRVVYDKYKRKLRADILGLIQCLGK